LHFALFPFLFVHKMASEMILPIGEISSYHTKWTIKARVTAKGNIRTFSKGASTGKVFSVDLLDKEGGEIRATFFNDAVDKFESTLQIGKCYVFSRGNVKIANKQFNPCNHRYEITFGRMQLLLHPLMMLRSKHFNSVSPICELCSAKHCQPRLICVEWLRLSSRRCPSHPRMAKT